MASAVSKLVFAEWAARICFAVVFAWNVMCALQFVCTPDMHVNAYQLDGAGAAGTAAIRGLGVAFLMWNATYPLFLWRPSRYRVLGFVIIAQQIIGLIGEMFIFASIAGDALAVLSGSIMRFIVFDSVGLVIMVVSLAVLWHTEHRSSCAAASVS